MNNIIIGNGIDIQFGGFEYTNKSIIERALLYLKTGVTLNVVPVNKSIKVFLRIFVKIPTDIY